MTSCHEKSVTLWRMLSSTREDFYQLRAKIRVGTADLNLSDQKQLTQDWILVSEETILSSPSLLGCRASGVFAESLIAVQALNSRRHLLSTAKLENTSAWLPASQPVTLYEQTHALVGKSSAGYQTHSSTFSFP